MKKAICLLLIFIFSVALWGCNKRSLPAFSESQTAPTEALTFQTQHTNISKDSVAEFIQQLCSTTEDEEEQSKLKAYASVLYNVTPPQVAAQTDMTIFKASDQCQSYVWVDGKLHLLCKTFGGYGFVNAVPCDFDGDGKKELLVASSWGSGIHRSVISLFDPEKEYAEIHSTIDDAQPKVDLIIGDRDNTTGYYPVYTVKIECGSIGLADLSYTPTGLYGYVEAENGAPVFKPAS
jgi:hypothetical protein